MSFDWGEASEAFDAISDFMNGRNILEVNEAQTRFDVIDRIIREVFRWPNGSIFVEEHDADGDRSGYVDYLLRVGDWKVLIEAKRAGAAFPNPTRKTRLKLNGGLLSEGEIGAAIRQAEAYAVSKEADIVVVTNGLCWCFYSLNGRCDDSYASLLFPFSMYKHAEELFNIFSIRTIESGGLSVVTNAVQHVEERLISEFKGSDARVDRNNIADYITPALDTALHSDALLSSKEDLERCFVSTEARTKFDSLLGMHLSDPKPDSVLPAKRIKRDKGNGDLQKIVEGEPSYAPPVTLIIGPVGAGKSTYLKHFELVSGSGVLSSRKAHWIYIDLEGLGKEGRPREFIYQCLREYLLKENTHNPTDYASAVRPAYEQEIEGLKRGPLAPLGGQVDEVNRRIADYIQKDYEKVEPYVDKVFRYIAKRNLCVIVLDNIDLYEDDALETAVFSEGLALSKRLHCNVIVSVRDRTFVRHRTDSAFDAYELRKLWIDPPPLKAVISARLTLSKKILEKRSADIPLPNGMHLKVPNLGVFFDIVQQSILRGQAGDYIDAVSDLNIRKGLTLVRNFLTSGHIQADQALTKYIAGDTAYYFPFHEIFKGTALGQWQYFREDRAECINIFDARLGVARLRLFRLHLLAYLGNRAKDEKSAEVLVSECLAVFAGCGVTETSLMSTLDFLSRHALIRNVTADNLSMTSSIVITRSGGYYVRLLSRQFVYVEECMYDTAIDDPVLWRDLVDLTSSILKEVSKLERMKLRVERLRLFLSGLSAIEVDALAGSEIKGVSVMDAISKAALKGAEEALAKLVDRERKEERRSHYRLGRKRGDHRER